MVEERETLERERKLEVDGSGTTERAAIENE